MGRADTVILSKKNSTSIVGLIDESLQTLLRQTPWPVILAGVDYEVRDFPRSASDCNVDIAEEFCMALSTMPPIASSTKRLCQSRGENLA